MAGTAGEGGQRIVVGVDGSDCSRLALEWAIAEARLRGAALDVVNAWHLPDTFGFSVQPVDYDPEGWAREALQQVLVAVDASGVDLRSHVRQGHPAAVLLDASKDASLLVIGTRGHGGFAGALLGSVSHHCVAHARCPVVVVPPGRD